MSPILFNVYSEKLMEDIFSDTKGIVTGGYKVKTMRYSDVIVIRAMNEK